MALSCVGRAAQLNASLGRQDPGGASGFPKCGIDGGAFEEYCLPSCASRPGQPSFISGRTNVDDDCRRGQRVKVSLRLPCGRVLSKLLGPECRSSPAQRTNCCA
eukprot:6214031-Pleurochrysis_carterae.AAC.3